MSYGLGSLSLLKPFILFFFFRKETVGEITFSMLYWFKYLRVKSFLFMDMYDNKLLPPATWEPLDEA